MTDLIVAISLSYFWFIARARRNWTVRSGRHVAAPLVIRCNARKPPWVREAVIWIKAMQPESSCRDIAFAFNRLHAASRNMTVGKSWVATTIRRHRYEVGRVRARVRNRKGRPGPLNRVWGLDLTGKADEAGKVHMILGLVDHGSRANLSLSALKDKTSISILRVVLQAIEHYGKPVAIRTDNESIFTSRLFRFALCWVGIRHQTTDLHCPWMNGRIERFFGTLKQKLDRWAVPNGEALDASLAQFRQWYNFIRPHQSLYGRTPAEIWNGTAIYRRGHRKAYRFDAWDGLLQGFYIPP